VTYFAAMLCAMACQLPLGSRVEDRPARLESVRRGMSATEVKQLIGVPQRITRVVLFRRHLEQWHYDDRAGYIEFACPRGEENHVVGVYSDPLPRAP